MGITKSSPEQIGATKQIEFATSMLMRMKEEGGSNILNFAEKATVSGANKYTFYRFSEGTVGDNTLNMYAGGATDAGNAGTAEAYQATIDYIYASDKIRSADLNSTSLDLKSSFVNTLTYAMKRAIDEKVLKPIVTLTYSPNYTPKQGLDFTPAVKTKLDDATTVNSLIEAAVFASTLAKETSVSNRPNVAIVVTAREFAILHRAERIINANYASVNKFQENTLFGCEVVKVADGIKGTDVAQREAIYFIPNGTFGSASWENDVDAKAWHDDGQDAMFCRAKRSIGVVLLEPESIIKVGYTNATTVKAPVKTK
ncbi:MAG: phage capsid protein [Cetobacterium sp.]